MKQVKCAKCGSLDARIRGDPKKHCDRYYCDKCWKECVAWLNQGAIKQRQFEAMNLAGRG